MPHTNNKWRWLPLSLKNLFWSFDEQNKFSSDLWNNWVFFIWVLSLSGFKKIAMKLYQLMCEQVRRKRPTYSLRHFFFKNRQNYKYCRRVNPISYVKQHSKRSNCIQFEVSKLKNDSRNTKEMYGSNENYFRNAKKSVTFWSIMRIFNELR